MESRVTSNYDETYSPCAAFVATKDVTDVCTISHAISKRSKLVSVHDGCVKLKHTEHTTKKTQFYSKPYTLETSC